MCGIVGYIGHQECGEILLDGLRRLEYRGYDSAGLAIHDGEEVVRLRAEGKLSGLERLYFQAPPPGTLGLAHTRWATHGRPIERNAHPHEVGGVVVVHNGIIENYVALRAELLKEGATFTSDTDTEIAAHLVSRAFHATGDLLKALWHALDRIRGSYALVVLSRERPNELVVARHASPLVLGVGREETFAASDVPAILRHTQDVIFLEDGDTARLTRGGHEIFDVDRNPVERPIKRITWDPISAEKQGYKHFMLKEIHEQPARVVDTLRGRVSADVSEVELREITWSDAEVQAVNRIIILACGTSYHAGMVARYAIEKLTRVPVQVDLASEFRYQDPVVDEHTLVIAVSQSGETADTLAALREARARGARALTICNVVESSIPRESDAVVYTQAGPEIGVASTKAYTTQLTALYLVALWLGKRRGTLAPERHRSLVEGLRQIPLLLEETLQCEEMIRGFASDFVNARGFLFVARGNHYPNALEGALKLKEISYIHAEGYAFGEMKHGPIALIDADLPVVAIAMKNSLFEKAQSNIQEVKARGGRLIVVTTQGCDDFKDIADHVIHVPACDPILEPLISVIPLQLLAYCIADAKGTDVDQPRNLAKSVTVE